MRKDEFAMLLESMLLLLDSGKIEEVKELIKKRLQSIDGKTD